MIEIARNKEYKQWLLDLKSKIKSSQLKAAVAVNSQLILLYLDLGRMIGQKLDESDWGDKVLIQVSSDLKKEFPDMKGFSLTNLKYCKRFFEFYKSVIGQQPVDQIPWGHNILIFSKSNHLKEAEFYIGKTIENNWSRAVLEYQIETNLFARQGKAINNFENTLPQPNSDLAKELLKNPYNFEFLSLSENLREKELEKGLVENITEFLLELGKGFAYIGKTIFNENRRQRIPDRFAFLSYKAKSVYHNRT